MIPQRLDSTAHEMNGARKAGKLCNFAAEKFEAGRRRENSQQKWRELRLETATWPSRERLHSVLLNRDMACPPQSAADARASSKVRDGGVGDCSTNFFQHV